MAKITATQHVQSRIKACVVNISQSQKKPRDKQQLKSRFDYTGYDTDKWKKKLKVGVILNEKE